MTSDTLAQMAAGLATTAMAGVFGLYFRHRDRERKEAESRLERERLAAKLELKVDTLWEFQLRRGLVEGKMSDVLHQNSPIRLEAKLKEALLPMADDLKCFYCETGENISEIDEATEIERRFGERLVKEVCIPLKIMHGACIIGAMVYGRSLSGVKKDTVLSSGHHIASAIPINKGERRNRW